MADDFNKLALLIEANTRSYERAMQRIEAKTNAALSNVDARAKRTESAIAKIGNAAGGAGALIGRLGAALGVGLSVREAVQLADQFTGIQNSLRLAGLEGEALTSIYDKLFASAQKNSAPVAALADLYGKLSLAQRELGISNDQLLGFTDKVGLALRVSGKSASEASGALLQLSQALGGGTVRAEEFNSMLEGSPAIVQAVARGLERTGGSVAKLRAEVNSGTVSSREFFDAFIRGSEQLEAQAASQEKTVSQAMVSLQNALVDAVGRFDDATGASGRLAQGIVGLADVISRFDVSAVISGIDAIENRLGAFGNSEAFKWWNELFGNDVAATQRSFDSVRTGTTDFDKAIADRQRELSTMEEMVDVQRGLGADVTELEQRIAAARGDLASLIREAIDAGPALAPSTPAKKSSLPDPLPAAPSSAPVQTTAPRSTSGRTGGRTIAEIPTTLRSAADAADTLGDRLGAIEDRNEGLRSSFADLASGIVSDFRRGASAADTMNNALDRVLSTLLDAGIQSIAANLFPVSPGPIQIAGKRALGGPVSPDRPYLVGEQRPEIFVPAAGGLPEVVGRSGPQLIVPETAGKIVASTDQVEAKSGLFDRLSRELPKASATPVADRPMAEKTPVSRFEAAAQSLPKPREIRLAGARAMGGPVGANRPYLVGERGPELFIPSTAGKVAPSVGSAAPIINISTPPGMQAQTSTRQGSGGASITDIVIAEVNSAIAGGKTDKAMGGRFGARPVARQR